MRDADRQLVFAPAGTPVRAIDLIPSTPDGSCANCRSEAERAETYRSRMKAADRRASELQARVAELLGEQARLKDDLDYYKGEARD